jgi:hypothetical protein
VAFESKKLGETERRWPTHEKEMWAVYTLSQDLGPLHRLQRCGGVDGQCDFEVLYNSTQVVIETSKVAKHVGFVQCGHPAQARKGKHSPQCLEPKTPT